MDASDAILLLPLAEEGEASFGGALGMITPISIINSVVRCAC
jgi:hypothetical protein